MEIAKVSFSGLRATVVSIEPVIAGTVGASVSFAWDDAWAGMDKMLVWRGSGCTIDDMSASGNIPAEVLAKASGRLYVGVYGIADGKVTPSLWIDLGQILPGADPSGDESADPSLPVWYESQKTAEQAVNIAEQTDRKVDETYQYVSDEFAVVRGLVEAAGTEAENAKDIAGEAAAIAKGRATGYVFNTVDDMDAWLNNPDNTAQLILGDNLYVREVDVPDYWWDGTQKQVLETQKVDLREYVKKTDYAGTRTPGLVAVPGFDTGNYGFIKGDQEKNPGSFIIFKAHYSDIDAKTHRYRPIVPNNLDYAVKRGVAYNEQSMTTAEKRAACKWFGTLNVIENSDGSVTVTMPSGKTKTVDLSKIEIFL